MHGGDAVAESALVAAVAMVEELAAAEQPIQVSTHTHTHTQPQDKQLRAIQTRQPMNSTYQHCRFVSRGVTAVGVLAG